MIGRSIAAVLVLAGVAAMAAACGGGGSQTADGAANAGAGGDPAPAPRTGTPVRVRIVRVDTLHLFVTASGRTDVLRDQRVRAPFAGTLATLGVTDGDRVSTDEVLGTMVSRSSEAAMEGALAMQASARTPEDSADARRALELARANRVTRALRAPEAGVVLSHSASPGDRLAEGDEIVRLGAAGSSVFLADVEQNDLADVRPGQPAQVRLSAGGQTLGGVVHGVLPGASSTAFSAPVRIDFSAVPAVPAVGLFGTATITVGTRAGVLSVSESAVLTDDITGVSRMALVGSDGRAHWVVVQPGVRDGGRVEVSSAGVSAGDQVIISGQVGLPESTPIVINP